MDVVQKAYLLGVQIAKDGEAVIPDDVLLTDEAMTALVAGYTENIITARVRVVAEWEDWSRYQDWFKKSSIVVGLTQEEIDILTCSNGWENNTFDTAARDGLIMRLSELTGIPLNGMRSSGPGSWYCSMIAWDARLYESTGTIEVYYTGGQDV